MNVTTALGYAARGWRVIPIAPNSKTPLLKAWQENATTDPETIQAWWSQAPDAGIGIATGRQSGVWVLDVDTAGGKRGDESLADLIDTYGPLPDTLETITGSGGRHVWFRYRNGDEIRNTAGRLGLDLDTRGEGGYVIAPPTLHVDTGLPYVFDSACETIADAPEWLYAVLESKTDDTPRIERPTYVGEERPGDRFASQHSWPELLTADGGTYLGTRTHAGQSYELWGRPGVDHVSASLYYGGTDLLKVFTSNWPGLKAEETYTRFGYFTATRYGGDFAEATRALGAIERDRTEDWTTSLEITAATSGPKPLGDEGQGDCPPGKSPMILDWPTFWNADHSEQTWCAYPLIPAGRSIAVYAPAKAGKSTIVLDVVAAAATGRPILGGLEHAAPVDVLYLDYEMTEADLQERLLEVGYTADDDLSRLHYALLPSIPPLDTPAGASALLTLARSVNAALVVVDTFGRAVEGEENDADTVRSFYRHTAMVLKADGIAVLRTDHSGKDLAKGQRGSSAKADDVDVVWQLSRTDTGVKIKRTHSRISWVPEEIDITKSTDEVTGIVSYKSGTHRGYAPGTKEKAAELDTIGAPIEITNREARDLLTAAGYVAGKQRVLGDAIRARKRDATNWERNLSSKPSTPERTEPEPTHRNRQGLI